MLCLRWLSGSHPFLSLLSSVPIHGPNVSGSNITPLGVVRACRLALPLRDSSNGCCQQILNLLDFLAEVLEAHRQRCPLISTFWEKSPHRLDPFDIFAGFDTRKLAHEVVPFGVV